MKSRSFIRVSCAAITLTLTLFVMPNADAAIVRLPFFFSIADCGTVKATGIVDIGGNTQIQCKVWDADSGGRYTFAGVESYNVGDRVFVQGQICFVCLSICPATPLINSSHMPCFKQ